MKTLLLATHNKGKIKEFGTMLASLGIEIQSAADYGLPEPEETEKTFAGNALLKARAACKATGLPALADDSGFCVSALGGQPGIHSARWAETPDGRDFAMAMQAVHDKVGDSADKNAWFMAVLALVFPDGREEVFEGRIDGHIAWPPRGDKGFGYDPMFVANGHLKTFAEMEPEEKHTISHRARAVSKFLDYLRAQAA
jgi:XTP/dITP diphosphohydrolase